ncbi:MAG: hypothetical protein PHC98_02410 [Syntrophotalea acetylenica]|nr:hypothetical protein [Syntrophotalea acetylenica]
MEHLVLQGAFFPQSETPILTRPDAFFYLTVARDLISVPASTSASITTEPSSILLAHLVAWLASFFSMEDVALILPVLLSLSMVLAILPWLLDTGHYRAASVAALFGLCTPYWLERTQLGALDTDPLIPFLLSGAVFSLHFAGQSKGLPRVIALFGFAGLTVLLHFWWLPGPFLLLVPSAFFGGSLFTGIFRDSRRTFCFVALPLTGLILVSVLLTSDSLPLYAQFAWNHLQLILGQGPQSLERASIIELSPFPIHELLKQTLGLWFLFPLPILGVWFWIRRYGYNSFYLLYILALGLAGLVSRRLLILGIPALAALTVCGGLLIAFRLSAIARLRPFRNVLYFIAIALPLVPNLQTALTYVPQVYFSAADVAACERINQRLPADTFVWTWWDYGYFVQYLTRRPIFFHGGSQDPARLFTAAYPLMQSDTLLAAKWLRYYSRHISPAFPPQDERRKTFLLSLENVVHQTKLSPRHVALFLPRRTFDASGFLYALAFNLPEEQVCNRLDLFSTKGFDFSGSPESVGIPQSLFDKGYREFGSVLQTSAQPVSVLTLAALSDPILVHSKKLSYVAITDRPFIKTSLFHLLGFFGDTLGFKKIWFDPVYGGLWEVLNSPIQEDN